MDKLIVEITEAKEGLDSLYSVRGFLVMDCLNLLWVNFNPFYTNNKPKVLYAFYSKFAFFYINL